MFPGPAAGLARAMPNDSGPVELPGLLKVGIRGPFVGVEAPLFGPGVGLKAMGLMRALPWKKETLMMNGHEIKADMHAKKVRGNAKHMC